MKNNNDYPETFFQLEGFSDDPIKRKQEIEQLRDETLKRLQQKRKEQNAIDISDKPYKYYRLDNGAYIKRNLEDDDFYVYNQYSKVWEFRPDLASILYDNFYKYEEIDTLPEWIDDEKENVVRRGP